jgi:DNA-binding transcriptional regulator YdaS (Cro superfamily)
MNKLRTWRKANKISATEAGKRIGVGRVQWFRMETGERSVAADKVLLVEAMTGIPRQELRPDVFGESA